MADVLLRDVTEEDLPAFFEYQLDPDDNRIGGFTPRDRDAFMAHWAKILVDPTVTAKTVVVDGQAAGHVVTFVRSGEREVGYWIGREFRGRGVASSALSQFLDQVEERPLLAHAAKANVGSIRVLENCGFTICGEGGGHSDDPTDVEEFILKLHG